MWLFLFSWAFVYVLYHNFTWYIWVVFLMWAVLDYSDGKERNGDRHWPRFRRWRLWKWLSPMGEITISSIEEMRLPSTGPRIYVPAQPYGTWVLFWSIGVHGGAQIEDVHYMVPPLLLYVPFLRNVLMWSGAVTCDWRGRLYVDTVGSLLSHGRRVCWSAGGEQALYQLAFTKPAEVIPFAIAGMESRYYSVKTGEWLREKTKHHGGYAFPQIFWLRCCQKDAASKLRMVIGGILRCAPTYYPAVENVESIIHSNCEKLTRYVNEDGCP